MPRKISHDIGETLICIGMTGLAVMSIAGYVSLLIVAASQGSYHSHHSHYCNSGPSGFWTGFLVGSLFSSGGRRYGHTNHYEMSALAMFALLVTVLALALSFSYGFGIIGVGFAIGWMASSLFLIAGAAVYESAGPLIP